MKFLPLLAFSLQICASDALRDRALESGLEPPPSQVKAAAPPLKGLILLGSSDDLIEKTAGLSGIMAKNVEIPGGLENARARLAPVLSGMAICSEDIAAIKNEIILYYRSCGRPFVSVSTPVQDVTDGVLQAVVIETRVGKISFSGNVYFPTPLLQQNLRMAPGSWLDTAFLQEDVSWMNQNPFRHTEAITSPGTAKGTTDIRFVSRERTPLRLFAGVDNTGNDNTGNARWFGGFTWANAFSADQLLTYQYTADGPSQRFQANTVSWTIPLPWRHIAMLYGGSSKVHPDIEHFDHRGEAVQASFRYKIPFLKAFTSLLQDFSFGGDFKETNSDLIWLAADETPLATLKAPRVNLTQLALEYHFHWEGGAHKVDFDAEGYISPVQWVPHQTSGAYRELRAGADPKYAYGRLACKERFFFAGWELCAQGRFQASTANLLPSEQFGLGGYNTVRGYQERAVNGDNGACANLELKTPRIAVLKRFKHVWDDSLLFLGFADYGFGANHELLEGEKGSQQLLGTGIGLRYNFLTHFQSRLDWGFPLLEILDHKRRQRIHFSAILSY